MIDWRDAIRGAAPGLLLSATIALAVRFVSDQLGGPAMLYALLFGMAFNFLTEDERFARGIRFFLIAWLLWYFGAPIKAFIERYLGLLTILFFVLLLAGFLVLRWL